MNLSEAKLIEDIKEETRTLNAQWSEIFARIRLQAIESGFSDFYRFFKEEGFNVEEAPSFSPNFTGRRLTASYKSMTAVISSDSFETVYMGGQFKFEIILPIEPKNEKFVLLNRVSDEPRQRTSGTYKMDGTLTFEEEKEKALSDKNAAVKDLEQVDKTQWKYTLYETSKNFMGHKPVQSASTMYDLLKAVIE